MKVSKTGQRRICYGYSSAYRGFIYPISRRGSSEQSAEANMSCAIAGGHRRVCPQTEVGRRLMGPSLR
jgi:hypothetical protein